MQGATLRLLILAGVFVAGAVLLGFAGNPAPVGAPRWPANDDLFAVEGWNVSGEIVERTNGMDYISRRYWRSDGTTATLILSTSPSAKAIYASGPDVPFHGNGFTVAPGAVGGSSQASAFTARKENEEFRVLYAFGERRGLAGNGPQAWALAGLDSLLGRPNDYFLARVILPLHEMGASQAALGADLAGSLFPRLADWYVSAP
jgi:Protein of unknown function (DUF3485)